MFMTTPYKPLAHDLQCLQAQADRAIAARVIDEKPKFHVEMAGSSDAWRIVVICTENDYPFWTGFAMGRQWCWKNSLVAMGITSEMKAKGAQTGRVHKKTDG